MCEDEDDKAWFDQHEGFVHVPRYPGWSKACVWDSSGNRKLVSKLGQGEDFVERSFEMWVSLARLDVARLIGHPGLCDDLIIMIASHLAPSFQHLIVGGGDRIQTLGSKRAR